MNKNNADGAAYYAMMHGVYQAMSQQEKDLLEQWEKDNLSANSGGKVATSDWPGWEKYIGEPPWRNSPAPYSKAKIPGRISFTVFQRDDFRCKRCGLASGLTVDHIHPERHGGTLDLDNLQTLCRSCNSKKGVKA